MRTYAFVAIFAFSIQTNAALAEDFNIEESDLAPVPIAIEASVRAESSNDIAACQLIGKKLDIEGHLGDLAFVVTTSNACEWGAAVGPIWVVRELTGTAKLILSSSGYSLTIGKGSKNGLRHIAISAATAGWYDESLWKFDGTMYKSVTAYHFEPEDKASCEAHPKICPWKF